MSVSLCASVAFPLRAAAAQTTAPGCRTGALSAYIKALVVDVFTSGRREDVNLRSRFGIPEALAADVVQITTDSVVCRRYRDLHNARLPAGYSASANVFVFYARGVHVVVDPKDGEHYMGWTFFSSTDAVLLKMGT